MYYVVVFLCVFDFEVEGTVVKSGFHTFFENLLKPAMVFNFFFFLSSN